MEVIGNVIAVDRPPYPEEDFSRAIVPASPKLIGIGFFLTASSGLPRSQAMSSIIAEDVAARARRLAVAENRVASWGAAAASTTDAGSGLGNVAFAISCFVARSITHRVIEAGHT